MQGGCRLTENAKKRKDGTREGLHPSVFSHDAGEILLRKSINVWIPIGQKRSAMDEHWPVGNCCFAAVIGSQSGPAPGE